MSGLLVGLVCGEDFRGVDGAVFSGGFVAGVDERHGVEVIEATNGGFAVLFQRAEEFSHGPDEGIGEPDGVPGRGVPLAIVVNG